MNDVAQTASGFVKRAASAYPGVYISGKDALRFAGWLKATDAERARMESLGVKNPTAELIALLESCYVEE